MEKLRLWLYKHDLGRSGLRWRWASFVHKTRLRFQKNHFKYRVSIAAIIKNEGPYLNEWIDYHLAAGFDHFYLFDNESADETETILSPYVSKDVVTKIPFPGRGVQLAAYNYACERFGSETALMAFIDADEFFVPSEPFLKERVADLIIRNIGKASGLAVNWVHFGNSNQETQKPGWVIDRFRYRSRVPSHPIKTIVIPSHVYSWESPHYPRFYKGFFKVDCGGEIVRGSDIENPLFAWPLHLNHYATKSTEEWIARKQKGIADNSWDPPSLSDLPWETFNRVNCNDVYDDSAGRYYRNMSGSDSQASNN